jgi:hypothetical protein
MVFIILYAHKYFMIFHTTCDELYYFRFYENFWKSIKDLHPEAKFSLNYVGLKNTEVIDFCKKHQIILSIEETTLSDLKKKFINNSDNDVLGYYPLCRWKSIPLTDENIIVCDVDILAIGKMDIPLINNLLEHYQAVNITRIKPNGSTGGMMLIAISKNYTELVRSMASNHDQSLTNTISIAEDVNVRHFIYENLSVYNLDGKMLDLSKPKYHYNGEWFAYSKGGQGEDSIRKIKRMNDNFKILKGTTNG